MVHEERLMIRLDKAEETLAREGSLSQLVHEIVSDLGVQMSALGQMDLRTPTGTGHLVSA